jgi:hypothetical protein
LLISSQLKHLCLTYYYFTTLQAVVILLGQEASFAVIASSRPAHIWGRSRRNFMLSLYVPVPLACICSSLPTPQVLYVSIDHSFCSLNSSPLFPQQQSSAPQLPKPICLSHWPPTQTSSLQHCLRGKDRLCPRRGTRCQERFGSSEVDCGSS